MIEADHFASQEIADRISDTAARVQRIQEKKKVSRKKLAVSFVKAKLSVFVALQQIFFEIQDP